MLPCNRSYKAVIRRSLSGNDRAVIKSLNLGFSNKDTMLALVMVLLKLNKISSGLLNDSLLNDCCVKSIILGMLCFLAMAIKSGCSNPPG